MRAGTLLTIIDTTAHDVYALLVMQQKVYGSWSLPSDATPAMRLLEEMRYDNVLWRNLPYDPDKERLLSDYSTVVDYDRREDEGFMDRLSMCISHVLWDAYCSYRERATRIMQDYANLSPARVEQALTFLNLSERFHDYYKQLKAKIEFKKVQELESLIRKGTGMYVWQLRDHVEDQERRLEAALRFTEHS